MHQPQPLRNRHKRPLSAEAVSISYPGNKGIKTLIPHLINLIPPHKRYIELFLGSAGVGRHLHLPQLAQGVEINNSLVHEDRFNYPAGMEVICDCAISWLQKHLPFSEDTFIYADPPYPKSCRRSNVDIYDYEMTDAQHVQLTQLLLTSRSMVMISSYENEIYETAFKDWNKKKFCVSVHGKRAYEVVYYNYSSEGKLHQYNFLGKNKTDRQRIKRKITRWGNKLSKLPIQEQEAIYNYLSSQRK